MRRGPGHHRHRPLPGLRRRPDQALAVVVRHQPALGRPGDHLGGQRAGLGEHAVGVRVVVEQGRHGLGGRLAGRDPLARLVQHRAQPVPLAVGLRAQRGEIDVDRLGAAEQPGQRVGAERHGRIALQRRPLQVRDEPGVRGERGLLDVVPVGVEPDGQPAGRPHGRARDRRRHRVERGQRRVDRLGPGGQVPLPGGGPLGRRRVLPVVAGQIQVRDVEERVDPVQAQLAEDHPGVRLERAHVRLVVRIGLGGRAGRAAERGDRLAYAVRGEILQHPVVLVQTAALTCGRNHQVAESAQPDIHERRP